MKQKQNETLETVAIRISVISIIVNMLLSAGKLLAGILAHSSAMISDAVHSASDVFSTIIVIIGIHISSKKADREHPYGHERLECIAAILLAVVLGITGAVIGYGGITKIVSGDYRNISVPGVAALVAAAVSILVKELMYRYTIHYAKTTNSAALKADAWHHRSDALSSIGALVGILFARLGFPIMDAVASVVICVFILKAALDIFRDAVDKVVDHAADGKTEDMIRKTILDHAGVQGISLMRTRMFGSKIYLDVEIEVDGFLTLNQAHEIAEEVHHKVEQNYEEVKHCMVHVNPARQAA